MSAVCSTCNDTHSMPLGDGTAMCTRCPTPCRRCASSDGRCAYCATTPCSCKCHPRRTAPPPDAPPTDEVATLRAQLATVTAERDEARALKVPPSVDELLAAKMDAATARTELEQVRGELGIARWANETRRKTVAAILEQRDAALARAEQAERALAEYKQLALTKTVAHPLVVAVESETAEQIAAWLESVRDYTSVWANCPVGWRRDVAEAVRRGAWRTTKGPSR